MRELAKSIGFICTQSLYASFAAWREDCGGRREDYGGELTRGRGRRADNWDGYYRGTDHKAPPAYHHQPLATAVDEAGHKAYHDGARKDYHVTADAGGHGGYAAYVHDKADIVTPKLSAWHNKVGDDAGYAYTSRLHETAADRRENGAVDYHHYPTTTTTTLVRY